MQIARNIRLEGLVQGVGFRDWAVAAGRGLGVTGWVRNRNDGSVEVLATGETELVERFVSTLRQGAPGSRVDQVRVDEAQVQALAGFARVATL